MTEPSLTAGLSPLDQAHALRISGDREGALRLCVALLEAAPEQYGAALLAADILDTGGRPLLAGEIAMRVVDAFVRRGDLPAAVVAAHVAEHAGEAGQAPFGMIAKVFGKGSGRIADVSSSPPPLPTDVQVAPVLRKLVGEGLFDRVEKALQKLLAEDEKMPEDSKVPELPLFGALPARALEGFLRSTKIQDAAEAQEIIAQGSEGAEAFVLVRGMAKAVRRTDDGETVTLAALGPGSVFGEMALVSDAPRAASVVAVEPCQLLVMSRAELEGLARREPAIGRQLGEFCRGRMVSNLIRHSAILQAVEPEERGEIVARFTTRTFEPGEALVKQGEETPGLFLIASGVVEVSSADAEGDRLVLAQLGPGDVVGEISLVLRRPANADVVATHPTVALELTREGFQAAIKDHPALLGELYELATKREEQTRSVVAQEAVDLEDVVLL